MKVDEDLLNKHHVVIFIIEFLILLVVSGYAMIKLSDLISNRDTRTEIVSVSDTSKKFVQAETEINDILESIEINDNNTGIVINDVLPEIDGFSKDSFGNYIISEVDLANNHLPIVNGEDTVRYNFYYTDDNIVINPMPIFYDDYMDLFSGFGG